MTDTRLPPEALIVVPEAVVKPSQVAVAFVKIEFVAKRFVLVVFVPVALVHVRPVRAAFPSVRLVKLAFVAKRFVEVELVEVVLVKTAVDGVVAPIEELLMVPPLIVSASDTFESESEPVIEPKDARASVTPALPSVPELIAVALTLPVASIVNPLTTIASVIELLGSETTPETVRLVVAELVEVELVKTPVDGVVAPIGALLMEPPVIATPTSVPPRWFTETKLPPAALIVVPEAVAKPSQVAVAFVRILFVPIKFVAKRLVLVVLVPVALVQIKPEAESELDSVKFVKLAFVAKRLVEVELVLVVLVKTAVDGVVAPMDELLIVPPLIVKASETLASESVPVIEPKDARARVTPALPRVPELRAVALTLPVASIVNPLTTIASVIELLGRETTPETVRFVAAELVLVELVKTPVDGVVEPIGVLLMEPPVMATPTSVPPRWFTETRLPPAALIVVPDAVVNPSHVAVALVRILFVPVKLVAKRLVDVVFVPVALVQVRPVLARLFESVKFVKLAFVANRFVEVELVLVTFVKTAVDGVVAPIEEPLIVPPLIVKASATLASEREPVMDPKDARASVTPALPRVPEFKAVALTLPVASIVNPLTTIASVIELLGRETTPETVRFVAAEFVEVVLVKTPVDGVVAPIGALLIEPPVIVTPISVPPS